jgi:cellulose synthase (UDP-forming)
VFVHASRIIVVRCPPMAATMTLARILDPVPAEPIDDDFRGPAAPYLEPVPAAPPAPPDEHANANARRFARSDYTGIHRWHPPPRLAGWIAQLTPPGPEARQSRVLAHVGGLLSIVVIIAYLTWRIMFTLPASGFSLGAAWFLIAFETLPIGGLIIKIVTLWDIDGRAPERVTELADGQRVAVVIPTYNEPVEVIAPTIAAACALAPSHETWVLDDGDRDWVEDLCAALGARYVRREIHDHAKAGNMNNALAMMAAEVEQTGSGIDFIAVLDCDHVPLPTFLTDTLGWFADPDVALVQAPQCYYNSGSFDDDGVTGEQGMFFNVMMPARNHDGAGPFWCGSTSLLRREALHRVGGVSTETIVEDMHTTLNLIRDGWKTVYHHQTVALGLAPATPEQYLVQRRRWGMGSMQVLVHERLWRAKRWLGWRNFYEYLTGTLWWLEGIATVLVFTVPTVILLTGATTSTAGALPFTVAFVSMFTLRLWGGRRLLRGEIHWPTAFALRVFRVPVGIACFWWLITRQTLQFQVTPKGAAEDRVRGRTPRVVWLLIGAVSAIIGYAGLGLAGLVPWPTSPGATVSSGVWLLLADVVLILGTRRIRDEAYATSRRNAYRVNVSADVELSGSPAELVDISVGGVLVRSSGRPLPASGDVTLRLPGADPIRLAVVRVRSDRAGAIVSLRVREADWDAYRVLSLWMFHTPSGVARGIPAGVPVVAVRAGQPG